MREKILKAEASLLFLFTLFSSLGFYFQGGLPDHFLTISSNNSNVHFFTYGLTSLLAGAEYFLGIWIIFPFLLFSILYGLFFVHRSYLLDTFLFIPILIFFLMLGHLFFPVMIGKGLIYLLQENIAWPYDWMILILSFTAWGAGCFRASFREHVVQSWPQWMGWGQIKKLKGLFLPQVIFKPKKTLFNKSMEFGQKLRGDDGPSYPKEGKTEDRPSENKNSNGPQDIDGPNRPKETPPVVDSAELIACLSTKNKRPHGGPNERYFQTIVEKIEDKLGEFNVDAKIIHILKGPVVDTFELELGEGVRVAQVTSLSQDLGLALSGCPIRIIYPMEGKTTVGIEVPRNPREVIFLDEVLTSKDFQEGDYELPLALGKNSFGAPFIVDLTKMPHMLVAGTTGAGKSVFINTLLVSLLVKIPPEKLKLMLIDPKQLELTLYRKLPHLVVPVITKSSQAAVSLIWAVEEMERRYSLLSELEVRSIQTFNSKIKTASPQTLSYLSPYYEKIGNKNYEIPYLVIIIDEFADLILEKNGKTIENYICRLAAKARACGIHLIIATQRPSVDVITGLIKANFPTRVSFRVTAGQDSRTILNSIGAESLLGKGDMLYKHGIEMRRLHSAYVDEEQIFQLLDKLAIAEPAFLTTAMEYLANSIETADGLSPLGARDGLGSSADGKKDPLYQEAVKIVKEHQTASASMLQRRFKVGYNRAANLIETMEFHGVIGPQQGSKPRQVLMESDFRP